MELPSLATTFLISLFLLDLSAIAAKPTGFLQSHCLECHDSATSKGGLDLESLPLVPENGDAIARWVDVMDIVRDGGMPPKKKPQPSAEERRVFLREIGDVIEEAARLRDEIKRLQDTELLVADDPFAKQTAVEQAAGKFAGKPGGKGAPRPKGRSAQGKPGTRTFKKKGRR